MIDPRALLKGISQFKEFNATEMTARQLEIFLYIYNKPGISQGEIAANMELPSGRVGQNIDRLSSLIKINTKGQQEESGFQLVKRVPASHASQRFDIELTDKGEKFLKALLQGGD